MHRVGGDERHLEPGQVHDVRRRVLGHDALQVAVPREVALRERDRRSATSSPAI